MFQFLLGTLITAAHPSCPQFIFVSIPLRYADNYRRHDKSRMGKYVSIPLRYADNDSLILVDTKQVLFQFLLGTLITVPGHSHSNSKELVSIPLRYADNPGSKNSGDCKRRVSIPLRYADNIANLQAALRGTGEFQFLLGTLITYAEE